MKTITLYFEQRNYSPFRWFILFAFACAMASCTKEIDTITTEEPKNLSTVTSIQLNAVEGFNGPCSKQFDFEAEIIADGPMTVRYTWLRSDGATAPESTIVFGAAGTKTVSSSWTLGESGNSYEGYWQQLKVITPKEMLSNKSEFDLYCEEDPVSITATAGVIGDNNISGACPQRFEFEGVITVDKPTSITYTWLRSDNATGPEFTIEFTEAGSQTVNSSWTLGLEDSQYDDFWRQLKVLAPQEILSEKAIFNLSCTATRIDFSTYSGESMNLSETVFAEQGIETIRTITGGYCSDALPAMLAKGTDNAPFSFLSTASPGDFNRCNTVPLEFTFTEPVKSVTIAFYGANVDYVLTAFNGSDLVLGNATATSTPYDYSEASLVSFTADAATIAKVSFGYTSAFTQIRSITFEH